MNLSKIAVLLPAVSALLVAGPATANRGNRATAQKETAGVPTTTVLEPATAPALPPEPPSPAKSVLYGERDIVTLRTKVRFTTTIILPKSEQIVDITCGDKDNWVVNAAHHLAFVKPGKVGAETNMNIIAASGNIYSFSLKEVSEDRSAAMDLKVFVEPKDDSMLSAAAGKPKFVLAQELDNVRQQAELAKEETRKVKTSTLEAIDAGITAHMDNMRFQYRFDAGRKPFFVRAMFNDDKFTYIHARPEETPTLYELKDGKPNLVNFTYNKGRYIVDKILDKGYLVIGKEKLSFSRQE